MEYSQVFITTYAKMNGHYARNFCAVPLLPHNILLDRLVKDSFTTAELEPELFNTANDFLILVGPEPTLQAYAGTDLISPESIQASHRRSKTVTESGAPWQSFYHIPFDCKVI